MGVGSEIERVLSEFGAGRRPFESLITQLEILLEPGQSAVESFQTSLQDCVNSGQIPYDLAVMIWRRVVDEEGQAGDEAATDVSEQAPDSEDGDRFRDKVDEVVVTALIDGFRSYRNEARTGATQSLRDDKTLDAALADFRGARFRRDATKAQAGQPRRQATLSELNGGNPARAVGVGTMLKDRFVLDKELGRGGMGAVYRAVDRRRLEAMHQAPYVALKLLSGSFKEHPDALRTLENEARKAQELAHPSIVTVYDFDRDQGEVFIVMELLQGMALDRLLELVSGNGLDDEAARRIVNGVGEGLAYAHERNVIHCDIKPANVFVLPDGQVKILDFGIASASRAGSFDAASLGAYTATYASPELEDGAPRDTRDDVYALGCVAYMAFANAHPFDRYSGKEARDRGMRPQPLNNVASHEWRAIGQALSFEREARQPTAGAFCSQFRGYAA